MQVGGYIVYFTSISIRIYLKKTLPPENPYEVTVAEQIQPRTAAILRRTLAHTRTQPQREPFNDVWFTDRSFLFSKVKEIVSKDGEDQDIPICVICMENYEQDH